MPEGAPLNSIAADHDIEKIKSIIVENARRCEGRGGDVTFVGVEGSTVKIVCRVLLALTYHACGPVKGLQERPKTEFPWIEQVKVVKPHGRNSEQKKLELPW